MSGRTLSKAASRFSRRVSRAFSFNKTPRKLKRAMSSVSQMISPFKRESGASNPLSPRSSDLRTMRLASVNDLTLHSVNPTQQQQQQQQHQQQQSEVTVDMQIARPGPATPNLSARMTRSAIISERRASIHVADGSSIIAGARASIADARSNIANRKATTDGGKVSIDERSHGAMMSS